MNKEIQKVENAALDNLQNNHLYLQIQEILLSARKKAYSAVNFAMVEAYWLVGIYASILPRFPNSPRTA